jgi:hypothetical protein
MAKADKFGGGLGKKPEQQRRANDIKRGITQTIEQGGMRDDSFTPRLMAFEVSANALQPLNQIERTQVVAALAEFFQLSLTVEN